MSRLVDVDCVISAGAFSSEKVYRLIGANGKEYIGGAPEHYFRNSNKQHFGPDEPKPGHSIAGTVRALEVSNGGDSVRVALPDDEAVVVHRSLIHPVQTVENSVESGYVSV